MPTNQTHNVGQTKDIGFQIGVRRSLPIELEQAWQLITSLKGLSIWLGNTHKLDFTKGAEYKLDDGSTGEVRVFKPNSHLRITYQPKGWPRASTIQVRVIPNADQTTIAFHQEHLPGPEERTQRSSHFQSVLDRLEKINRI